MNDNPNNDGVEPPDEDFIEDTMAEEAIEQANHFHRYVDGSKTWSRNTASELRVQAALEDDEERADELRQVAELVETVTTRIEQGDNSRARQP